ncbi:MAG: RagB/SusD family nutrient uptake outer membrane protein, partial [Muribaculaceae bacterium]
NASNNESIIYSLYVPDIRMHNVPNETCCPVDYIRLNPSKSLVDAYLCTDGMPAKTGLEYYKREDVKTSPLYKFPEEHYADYFKNRDPRMQMTLYAPGDKWPGGDDGDKEVRKPNPIFNLPRFSSLQSGNNGANGRTGFYLKKYNDPMVAGNYNLGHGNLNVIRFPEILLIYAEAKYNIQGNLSQSQIDYTVNKLRDRVGMHRMILTELSEWNLNLQTELRRERTVEMTFDGMRYADVMRWKEGELRFGRAITGPSLQVCLNDLGANPYPDTGVDEFGDVIYEKSKAEGGARYFDPAMHYLWPVPYAERIKNPLLGQNPGWPK